MAKHARHCEKCQGFMELRLGTWECQKCGHTEAESTERKVTRRRRAARPATKSESTTVSSAADWKTEHGTHMLDFSKGTGRTPEHVTKPPPPPPAQPEYQTIQEFTKRATRPTKYYVSGSAEDVKRREDEQKLTLEKHLYFGLWLLLSAYVCYSLMDMINQGLFAFDFLWYEVVYIAVFCVAVMIMVMWYTLYSQALVLKWIFIIIGCFTALAQAGLFLWFFTNEYYVSNLAFDSGVSGIIGLVVAAILTVGWTGWYVHILWRDVGRMQA